MYQKPCRLTRADKAYMGGGSAPSIPQQSLGGELGDILHYEPKFVQSGLNLSNEFAPQFTQQDLALSKWAAPAYAKQGLDVTQEFAPKYAQTGFDIANKMSPQYLGLNLQNMQSAIAGSPLLSQLNTQSQSGLTSAYGNLAGGGVDPLLGQLTTQAQQQLGQQGHLTDQEAYQATQGTLGAFAGRNNAFNQAEGQSFLDRDALVRQRQQQAQSFAGSVEAQRQGAHGLAQSQLGQAQNFGLSTQGMNQAALQGLGGAVTAPNYAGYAQAPNLAAYAAPGASYAPMSAGMGTTAGQTQSLLNFGQNLFDANQNAAATQNIAASNKSGGMTGAGIGAVGSIAGGLIAAL